MSAPAAASPPLRDPYEIFARARAHWESAAYPKASSYSIVVSVTKNGTVSQAHYHARYVSADGLPEVDPTSDEERAHPYTPRGINTVLNLFSGSIPLSAPQQTFDYLGVPNLVPNYSFGIARYVAHAETVNSAELIAQIRRQFPDPEHHSKKMTSSGPLKTIASVVVVHRHYTMTFDGIEPVAGHPDYHISLEPLSDPQQYRLREVWIDESTFATDRLISQGNFTNPEFAGTHWQVDFQQIGGAPYISSESVSAPFTINRRHYDSATIAFTNIAPTSPHGFMATSLFATDPNTAPMTLVEPATADQ